MMYVITKIEGDGQYELMCCSKKSEMLFYTIFIHFFRHNIDMAGRHMHRRASAPRPHVHPHILHLRFPEEDQNRIQRVATPPTASAKSRSPKDQLQAFSSVLVDESRMTLRVIDVFPAKVDREGSSLPLEDCEWCLTASCLRRSRSTRLRKVLMKMLDALQEWDDYCRMREQSLSHTHSPTITGKRRITELDKVKFDVELQRYQVRRNRKPTKISKSHFNKMLQLADSPQQREEIISWKMRSSLEFDSENDEGIKKMLDQSEQHDCSEGGSSEGTPRLQTPKQDILPTVGNGFATSERVPIDSEEEDPGLSSVSSLATTVTNAPTTPIANFQKASLKVDLRSLLGFGAHGRVYLGQLESSSFAQPKQVAVKKVDYTVKHKKKCSLLKSELAIWKSLAPCKYIVKYYGHLYNKKESCYSIVMEYCNFGSIQDLLNRLWFMNESTSGLFLSTGQMSKETLEDVYATSSCCTSEVSSMISQTGSFPTQDSHIDSNCSHAAGGINVTSERPLLPYLTSRRVVAHLCRAVEFLHAQNIIHRDIKISNILLSPDGYLRLCDFGVSTKMRSENSVRNSCVGTLGYLAPEVIQEMPHSTAADIWSLGCTMLELLSGKKPYSDLNAGAVLMRTVNDPHPAIPGHLSEDSKSFLHSCLVKDPSLRCTASQLLSHPLLYPVLEQIIVE